MECHRVLTYTLLPTYGENVRDKFTFKAVMKKHFDSSTDLARIKHANCLTPEQRMLAGLEQSELAIEVVKDRIRDQNPDADKATIQIMLADRVKLMRKIQNRRVPTA